MYTETELRDMLRASADRAQTTSSTASSPEHDDVDLVLTPTPIDRSNRRARRAAAPLAVAAATIALAGVAVALTYPGGDSSDVPAGDDTSAAAPVVQRHQALTPILDVAALKPSPNTQNDIFPVGEDLHGQQVIHKQLPGDRTMNLVIAPAKAFDDKRVSKSRSVTIAGTTGYYDELRLFPLSANGAGGSATTGTVVFRTPDGHWAFAYLNEDTKNNTVDGTPVKDPAEVVKGYNSLGVTFAADTYRTPLKLGYLPAGARFSAAGDSTGSGTKIDYSTLDTHGDDYKQMGVWLTRDGTGLVDGTDCSDKKHGCTTRFHRAVAGGWTLVADGLDYPAAETRNVLAHVELAADLSDRSTYFTLADAIG